MSTWRSRCRHYYSKWRCYSGNSESDEGRPSALLHLQKLTFPTTVGYFGINSSLCCRYGKINKHTIIHTDHLFKDNGFTTIGSFPFRDYFEIWKLKNSDISIFILKWKFCSLFKDRMDKIKSTIIINFEITTYCIRKISYLKTYFGVSQISQTTLEVYWICCQNPTTH